MGVFGQDEALERALKGGFVDVERAEVVLAAGVGGGAAGAKGAGNILCAGKVHVLEGVGRDGRDLAPGSDIFGGDAGGFAVASVCRVMVILVAKEGTGECVELCVGPAEWIVEAIPALDGFDDLLREGVGVHGMVS